MYIYLLSVSFTGTNLPKPLELSVMRPIKVSFVMLMR